jgi:ribosome-associated protein
MRLEVAPGIVLSDADIDVVVSRSGGPGGQHVNRTESRVQLFFHLDACAQLSFDVKARVRALFGSRVTDAGDLLVTSDATRDQRQNLADAGEKLVAMLRAALVVPKARRKTKPTKGSQRRRIAEKKRRSDVKKGRGRVGDD